MFKKEAAIYIGGTLEDLLGNTIVADAQTNIRKCFYAEHAGAYSQGFIPAADEIGFLRFDDWEIQRRFTKMHVGYQRIMLTSMRIKMKDHDCKVMHLEVPWTPSKKKVVRIRSWNASNEQVLSFDLVKI